VTDAREFLEAFRETARSLGSWRVLTPTGVVSSWRGFVEQCEEGYGDSTFEFHNDLSVRTLIMKLLEHPALSDYEQMGWVREEVAAIDDRGVSRGVGRADGRPWFEPTAQAELGIDTSERS
jgi:hypothetical protein